MPERDSNLNALWCRAISEELQRAGVVRIVACPGSRNSPLLFALVSVFGDRLRMAVDERGAGFQALGAAKALDAPVAVCVTSGTAAANLLPAVCEAAAAGIPLILLTADRPWEAHGCGSPQTMNQRGLFGTFADAVEIGEPLATDVVMRLLRSRVSRAVQAARRPVHLNVPLRDPLPPLPDPAWRQPALSSEALEGRGELPFVLQEAQASACFEPGRLKSALPGGPGLRGLIVAGSTSTIGPALVALLAAGTGYPVLADAVSGVRRPTVPGCVGSLDAVIDADWPAPELIIRIGGPPLTRTAFEWLGRQQCPQIVLGGPGDSDFLATASFHAASPDESLITDLITRLGPGDPGWSRMWAEAELRAQAARAAAVATGWNEPMMYAAACALDVPLLWLASSMPVRHANLHLEPRHQSQRVFSNRGLAGIDGTVAAFLGAAQALDQRGLCLIGDLALLHDLNSLALAGGVRGAIVVVNNGGGAIFDALPVAAVVGYRQLVRADHDLDFAHAAAQFRLPYRHCRDRVTLAAALTEAANTDALLLIECDARRQDSIADHRAVVAAMRSAAVRPSISG